MENVPNLQKEKLFEYMKIIYFFMMITIEEEMMIMLLLILMMVMTTTISLMQPQSQLREVERFRAAHRHIVSTFWNQFVSLIIIMIMTCIDDNDDDIV